MMVEVGRAFRSYGERRNNTGIGLEDRGKEITWKK
jgi:hypothetical protein